eukprot:1159207-Pelagomonas_calceolata.AAC.2
MLQLLNVRTLLVKFASCALVVGVGLPVGTEASTSLIFVCASHTAAVSHADAARKFASCALAVGAGLPLRLEGPTSLMIVCASHAAAV